MMIKEFGIEIAQELRHILGSEYIIEYQEIIKNNAAVYHALVIRKETENIAPTIYIDGYFKAYKDGISKDNLVNQIAKMYIANAPGKDFDASFFTDFAMASTLMTFKVINYEKNKKYLLDIPYKKMLDLALVPVCMVSDVNLGEGNIVIKNDHLRNWEVSFDELWENVFEYAERIAPACIEDIFDVVSGMDESMSFFDAPKGMMVVSNKQKVNGASVIFYPGMMEKMASKLGGNLVILPSSIHETIVFKAPEEKAEISALVRMVREVNKSVVCDEEILSGNVYFYDKGAKELSLIED